MREREPPWSEIPTRAELRAEIERLQADFADVNENRAFLRTELERLTLERDGWMGKAQINQREIERLRRIIDLVMAHDSNLIDHLERLAGKRVNLGND